MKSKCFNAIQMTGLSPTDTVLQIPDYYATMVVVSVASTNINYFPANAKPLKCKNGLNFFFTK